MFEVTALDCQPPTVRLSSSAYQFLGLSSPTRTSAALLEGPKTKGQHKSSLAN